MRNNASRKTWSTWRTTCHIVTLSNTNPTGTGLGLKLRLCDKRLESNHLSDSMDVGFSCISIMVINSYYISQSWNVLPVIKLPSLIWQNVAVRKIESKKGLQHYWSDDFRVLDILLWNIVLTVKRGKCWACVVLLTGMERRPWKSGFISKYLKKFN